MCLVLKQFFKMRILGEYFNEEEWAVNFHSPGYWPRKESLVNITGFTETRDLKESMSTLYLACAKYERMFLECQNYWGAEWVVN